ncbi:2OG-Fe(II) oxygenase [Streptomyces sp. NBC_01288]|uniref:2OG-Fe(II) oxygenase n=1 Tax=Streptomyces sp. NBC_01288 TaxID=2903814 RepID=UPI002E103A2C|nr:2OG-Fe(II) oxygenase [Streptomyces sp. NBC_01288]
MRITEARRRAENTNWSALAEELDLYGSAPTAQLLTPAECHDLAALYEKPELFRTTVDMARHRFGSGAYRYFAHDLPAPVAALRAALYPRLLPIARDRPVRTKRGWSAGAMRHGVSTVRTGQRHALGLVFHDAT